MLDGPERWAHGVDSIKPPTEPSQLPIANPAHLVAAAMVKRQTGWLVSAAAIG
jgi:hypothetical protein